MAIPTALLLCSSVFGFLPAPLVKLPFPLPDIERPGTIHHKDQTNLEYNAFVLSRFQIPENQITSSMKNAREQIAAANAQVDDAKSPYGEKDKGECHFDNEMFLEGHLNMMKLRSEMIGFLQTGDALRARIWFGRQLHALQDFYAHSNWVEMAVDKGLEAISPVIGVPDQVPYPKSPPDFETCTRYCRSSANDPNFDLQSYQENLLCLDSCKLGDQTPRLYVESWACVNRNSIGSLFKKCQPTECSSNLDAGNVLTSGYYGTSTNPGKLPKKCAHGGLGDIGAFGVEGINKDSNWPLYAPHYKLHMKAVGFSKSATARYFKQLETTYADVKIGTVPYPQPKLTERQLKLLLGIGSSDLVFIIDTTESMTDVIEAAKKAAIDIVNSFKVTPDKEPTSYILMGFNDPAGPAPIPTADADTFNAKISALTATGGGDCLEPSMEALSKTLDVIADDARVFIFTDAGPKDPALAPEVVEKMQQKNVKLSVFLYPSSCSARDTYDKVSGAGGGQVVAVSNAADTASLVKYALKQINPLYVSLYSDKPLTAAAPPVFRRAELITDLSVENGMESITISSSGTGTLTLTRPDGTVVKSGDANVDYVEISGITIITISSPASGVWHVFRSDPTSDLNVFGASLLTLNYFRFVEVRGGHPGWFPILDPLVVGQELVVNTELEGDYKTANFELRSATSGATLQKLNLERFESPDEFPRYLWWGNATVPCGPFYAYAFGEDSTGGPFQRVYPTVYDSGAACNGTANYTLPTASGHSATGSGVKPTGASATNDCGQTGTAIRPHGPGASATGANGGPGSPSSSQGYGCRGSNCTTPTFRPAQFTGHANRSSTRLWVLFEGLVLAMWLWNLIVM
jgi:von Willebrand factor A domain-containing protein 7